MLSYQRLYRFLHVILILNNNVIFRVSEDKFVLSVFGTRMYVHFLILYLIYFNLNINQF